jgi:integrase
VDSLGDAEVERLLEQAATAAHRALLLCMIDAGMKRDELLALRVSDLALGDRAEGTLTVQRGLATKRVRTRTVPLTTRLAEALTHQARGLGLDDQLFPLSTRGVDYIVREAGTRAELGNTGSLTPQRLRDTCAVRWMHQRLIRELAEPEVDATRRLEAEHDRELAELLGLAPESLSVERYRRAARRQLNRSKTSVLMDD